MSACLLPGIAACDRSRSDERNFAPSSDPATRPPMPRQIESADVQAEVTFREVPAATRLDSRFAGLSYEKTKLTVPMFTAANTQ